MIGYLADWEHVWSGNVESFSSALVVHNRFNTIDMIDVKSIVSEEGWGQEGREGMGGQQGREGEGGKERKKKI